MRLLQKVNRTDFDFQEDDSKLEKGRGGAIRGYGSTFGNVDLGRDIVEPGAFASWLSELSGRGKRIRMTDTHGEVIGDYKVAVEDERGLLLEGETLKGVQQAEESLIKAKAGVYDSMSIGFHIEKGGFFIDDDGVRHLTHLTVPEVAVLAFPMNEEAAILGAKSINTKREMERWLRDAADLSKREAQTLLAHGWTALEELREAGAPAECADESIVDALKKLSETLKGGS